MKQINAQNTATTDLAVQELFAFNGFSCDQRPVEKTFKAENGSVSISIHYFEGNAPHILGGKYETEQFKVKSENGDEIVARFSFNPVSELIVIEVKRGEHWEHVGVE